MKNMITECRKATKAGVVKALNDCGFVEGRGPFPPALIGVVAAESYTSEEWDFAVYVIHDNDCGGAWNDPSQLNFHLV